MQENQHKASINQHETILQFPNLVLLTKFLRYLLQKFLPNLMYNKHLGKRQHPISLFQLKTIVYFMLFHPPGIEYNINKNSYESEGGFTCSAGFSEQRCSRALEKSQQSSASSWKQSSLCFIFGSPLILLPFP